MGLLGVKGLMKEKTLGAASATPGAGFASGLLKKKPFAKPSVAVEAPAGLMKRLTGK